MLKLTIANTNLMPAFPDIHDSAVEVWQDRDGKACAYGYVVDSKYWMYFPQLASYSFTLNADEVVAFPEGNAQLTAVWDTYYRSVLPIALQVFGREALHASAVQTQFGVVAFCAVSETGKSTIAYGLKQRGYPLWADDAVVLDFKQHDAFAIPLPFSLRLRWNSAKYFQHCSHNFEQPAGSFHPPSSTAVLPIAAICILEQQPSFIASQAIKIQRLSPLKAVPLILAHAYCFNLKEVGRKRKMVENYCQLAANIPIFTVQFATGLENLPQILTEIERQILLRHEHNSLAVVSKFASTLN
jgi:hypothetical protein